MGEVLVPPDPVKLVLAYLAEHDIVAQKNRPNPVAGEVVIVRRIGGTPSLFVVDQPWLYVETFASTDEAASDLAHLVWALLFSMAGEVVDGVQCYEANGIAGPADMPDPDAQQPRFAMTVQLAFRNSVWTPAAST